MSLRTSLIYVIPMRENKQLRKLITPCAFLPVPTWAVQKPGTPCASLLSHEDHPKNSAARHAMCVASDGEHARAAVVNAREDMRPWRTLSTAGLHHPQEKSESYSHHSPSIMDDAQSDETELNPECSFSWREDGTVYCARRTFNDCGSKYGLVV